MKQEYQKPALVVHGDMETKTLNAGCPNQDFAVGTNNAFPNPTPSGQPGACV